MTARRACLVALLAAAILPYFIGLGATSIVDANEAYYTETPREMIESGDWINPTFNFEPRFNKPPLSYWVVALSYEAFGVSLWSARFPIALGAVAIFATVFVLGRLAFSTDAGLLAALTLAASPRVLLFARRIIIDVYTAMFCGAAVLFFALAQSRPARRRLWLALMYVAIGLGVMTKGPVGAVLPALAIAAYFACCENLVAFRRLMLPLGIAIVALIVVPYYAALYAEHGWTQISRFVLTENIGRFTEGTGAPNRGLFFFIPIVLADLYFPWSLALPIAFALVPWRLVAGLWKRWRSGVPGSAGSDVPPAAERIRLLLVLWILAVVAFFSLSRAQQDLYVLPFVAGAAPLVGGLMEQWTAGPGSQMRARFTSAALLVVALILGILGASAAWLLGSAGRPVTLAGAAPAGVILVAGALALGWWTLRRARFTAIAAIIAAVVAVHWIVVLRTMPDYERYKHVPQLARVIQARASPAAEVCTYKLATPSLTFLLHKKVFFVEDEGALRQLMQRKPELYCMMPVEQFQAVRGGLGAHATELARVSLFADDLGELTGRSPLRQVVLVTNRAP